MQFDKEFLVISLAKLLDVINKYIFVLIFMSVICFNFVNTRFSIFTDITSAEKRIPFLCPSLELKTNSFLKKESLSVLAKYPGELDKCFGDNFSLRNRIIQYTNYSRLQLFNSSPNSQVIKGKDGWFYYAYPDIQEYHKGNKLFSDEELRKWKNTLEARERWLKSQNVKYYIVVPPNKSTIYNEFLPNNFSKKGKVSRLDQLIEYLNKNSDIKIVDFRSELMQEKNKERVYYKTDSHWNRIGAFSAYKKIIAVLKKQFPTTKLLNESDYNIIKDSTGVGDLSLLMSLQNLLKEQDDSKFYKKTAENFKQIEQDKVYLEAKSSHGLDKVEYYRYLNQDKSLPKAVFFRDSYLNDMKQFLNDSFSDLTYVTLPLGFDTKIVSEREPDLVVQEFVETNLMKEVPDFEY